MIAANRLVRSRLLLAATCCAALLWSLAGCQQASRKKWDPTFDDPFVSEAEQLRPKKSASTRKLGLSSRSQQIEEDLGVR